MAAIELMPPGVAVDVATLYFTRQHLDCVTSARLHSLPRRNDGGCTHVLADPGHATVLAGPHHKAVALRTQARLNLAVASDLHSIIANYVSHNPRPEVSYANRERAATGPTLRNEGVVCLGVRGLLGILPVDARASTP